jgi:hypothetical protein
MILANATIYTADPARHLADAMAIRAGRVLRVGTYESVKVVSCRCCHSAPLLLLPLGSPSPHLS